MDRASDQVPETAPEDTSSPPAAPESPATQSPSHSTGGGGGGSSWWGSWIDTAKSKSVSVLEAVKKDLDELKTVVKTEATNAGSAIAETLNFQESESTANNVKKSISSFFDQVTEALSPTLNDDDEPEAVLITKDGAVTLTGLHKHLAELQANDDIYLVEPDLELAEKYQRWMEVVDQDQFTQQRLDRQLASSHILQEKYERLVPKDVTNMQFWQRYLFKRALLEDALANADLAERRAKQEAVAGGRVTSPGKQFVQTEQPKKVAADETATDEKEVTAADVPVEPLASIDEELSKLAEKELKWKEDPEISCAGVELSEEEQARLLAEYEQEIQERERKTSAAGQKTPQKKEQPAKGKKQAAGGGNKNQNQKGASGKNAGQRGNTKGAAGSKAAEKATVKDDSDESWEKEFDLDE